MDDTLAGLLFGAFLGMVAGTALANGYGDYWWQNQIQQRGYSEYCQTDGSWSWKGECK